VIQKKVCMLGAYAVGKTSLVQRFVKDVFSDTYQTTVGVKITKKTIAVGGEDLSLLLWDLHGDDEFQTVHASYLRGASGALLVADGTRASTLERALELQRRLRAAAGEVPVQWILNKNDLEDDWVVNDERLLELELEPAVVLRTSAKTGDRVEDAFQALARRMREG